MKADLASAYAASLARVASWAIVGGALYRVQGPTAFAAFSLIRAIMTAVALSGLGLAPALTILLPQFRVVRVADQAQELNGEKRTLDYQIPRGLPELAPSQQLLNTALRLVFVCSIIIVVIYSMLDGFSLRFAERSKFWEAFNSGVPLAMVATLARVFGDVAGARLQTTGRLTLDYVFQTAAEIAWVATCLISFRLAKMSSACISYSTATLMFSNFAFAMLRWFIAARDQRAHRIRPFKFQYSGLLIRTGAVLMLAQFADLLYGPANQAMIQGYLSADALATYAPLLHIDAALLLGVGGLATLLLPKTAVAMGAGNPGLVRRYYVNGTLASLALLAAGAGAAWAFAPRLFTLWFNDPLPATAALLPLVMIHTVIGGSAGVGRAVLFGLNRAKAYTAAALVGGVANVGLAVLLVTHTSLGLRAIVLATIITVALRCGVWMPWYVMKTLRQEEARLIPLPMGEVR